MSKDVRVTEILIAVATNVKEGFANQIFSVSSVPDRGKQLSLVEIVVKGFTKIAMGSAFATFLLL